MSWPVGSLTIMARVRFRNARLCLGLVSGESGGPIVSCGN